MAAHLARHIPPPPGGLAGPPFAAHEQLPAAMPDNLLNLGGRPLSEMRNLSYRPFFNRFIS